MTTLLRNLPSRSPSALALALLVSAASGACGAFDATHPARAPLADKWFTRAKVSYKGGDLNDASMAVKSALQAAPSDPEVRILAARVALARLDYPETLRLTEGMQTTEAHSLRGRARWFSGDIDQAADELEAMLQDPSVRDNWASDVAKLARRGQGRHPFAMEGGYVASVEMPKAGPALIVPCELEGENILALVATASSEVIVDASTRREPAWVNLRFGERIEVKDVPAIAQDLSGVSHELGAPIKALLGANLLRHIHATFDRRGDQFVVRHDDPTPPPEASRVPLWYVRGGGMFLRAGIAPSQPANGGVGADETLRLTPLLVDTSSLFPVALQDSVFTQAGVDLASLHPEPGTPNLKTGTLPSFKIGAFDLPKVPAVEGAPMADVFANVDLDMGGIVGAGLLSVFRVTFGDEGRFIWIEPDPVMMQGMNAPPPPSSPQVSPDTSPSPPPSSGGPARTGPAPQSSSSASPPNTMNSPPPSRP